MTIEEIRNIITNEFHFTEIQSEFNGYKIFSFLNGNFIHEISTFNNGYNYTFKVQRGKYYYGSVCEEKMIAIDIRNDGQILILIKEIMEFFEI